MKQFIKVVIAEAVKQHRNYFHSKLIYISLFVWPFLSLITTFYGFKAFDLTACNIPYINAENMLVYLVLGYMCMSFFRSLVQSAWQFSFERMSGTLELIYLSPASRQGVLIGNAISSVFESVVMMVIFSVATMIYKREVLQMKVLPCIVIFGIVAIMAVLWGILLNALFLFSRDTDILFTILEEPMEIFAGVKVPTAVFPVWAKCISVIFPLTYAIDAVRRVVLQGSTLGQLQDFLVRSIIIILILYIATLWVIWQVEKHSRKTGNFTLF